MSTSAPTSLPAVVSSPTRATVTVLAGIRGQATAEVTNRLLAADPSVVAVSHDLTDVREGWVRRTVRDRDRLLEDEKVHLEHGCVSCTLREDVLPTLVRLARADPARGLVLVLPEAIEPAAVAGACAYCLVDGAPVDDWLRFDSYLTVVDSTRLLTDLTSTDELADRGLAAADDDDRRVGEVLARQIEFADTVLLWEHPDQEPYERARHRVLAHRLAPWATHLTADETTCVNQDQVRGTGRHRPDTPEPVARGLEGHTLGVHEPDPDCGVVSLVFWSRRPMHPRRLHLALETVASQAIRSRGHLWLASQPELAVGWESAGGRLTLGSLGNWLVSAPESLWQEASDVRRAAATLGWDPYYGDRSTHLAIVGLDLDPDSLHRRLEECLLTDLELSTGQEVWRSLPDPFASMFDEDSPAA